MKTKKLFAIIIAGMLGTFQAQSQTNVTTTTGGTSNTVSKFTSTYNIENSQITDDGTNVGINDATPSYKLDVNGGDINVQTNTKAYRIGGLKVLWENQSLSDLFVGHNAGASFISASGNTFVGASAGYYTTSGAYNNYFGNAAGWANTTGSRNTCLGHIAGYNNVTGDYNTSCGYYAGAGGAGSSNSKNCFYGYYSGAGITAGGNNVFMGYQSGLINTTGANNTFIGYGSDGGCASCSTLTNATAIGYNAKVDADDSFVLGGTGADAVSVGIGTTTPSSILDLEDASTGSTGIDINNTATDGDPRVAFQLSGTSAFTMGVDDSDGDKFKIGTTAIETNTILTIDGSAVGIGTTSPSKLLHIYGTETNTTPFTNTIAGIKVQNVYGGAFGSGADVVFGGPSNSNIAGIMGLYTVYSTSYGGDLLLGTNPGTGIVERMRITSAGKVGLGVTAPTYFLEVGTTSSNGNGAYVTNGGVWTDISDRTKKEPIPFSSTLNTLILFPKASKKTICARTLFGTKYLTVVPSPNGLG